MTTTVKAIYERGALRLTEPIELEDGTRVDVIVIAPEPDNGDQVGSDSSRGALEDLIAQCAIDTGIPDLAHQHDHYLYGTPKQK